MAGARVWTPLPEEEEGKWLLVPAPTPCTPCNPLCCRVRAADDDDDDDAKYESRRYDSTTATTTNNKKYVSIPHQRAAFLHVSSTTAVGCQFFAASGRLYDLSESTRRQARSTNGQYRSLFGWLRRRIQANGTRLRTSV